MKNTLYILGAILAVIILIFVATGSNKSDIKDVSFDSNKEEKSTNTDSQTRDTIPAPDFSLEKLGGGTITLSEFKGNKAVVLDFWATWCHNCQRDMPRLNVIYEKYKDKVEVIGMNLQENPSIIQKFIDKNKITFPIALDPNSQATRAYGVRYTNYHVLIDIDGNIVKIVPGDINEADVLDLIK